LVKISQKLALFFQMRRLFLKDSLIQKVDPIPSSSTSDPVEVTPIIAPASSSKMLSSERCRQIHRAVTTIGLAVSMGTTAFCLLNRNQPAQAANSKILEAEIVSIPSPEASERDKSQSEQQPLLTHVKLSQAAIEHEVKQGESLWRIAKEYQIEPETIAASNKISPQANLQIGQSLKILSLKKTVKLVETTKLRLPKISNPTQEIASEKLDASLKKLRESRKRLQENLTRLKFEQIAVERLDFSENHAQKGDIKTALPKFSQPSTSSGTASRFAQKSVLASVIGDRKINFDRPIAISLTQSQTSQHLKAENNQPRALGNSSNKEVYQVQAGDTIDKIARFHGVSVTELIRVNHLRNPNAIAVAEKLVIPSAIAKQQTSPAAPILVASAEPVALEMNSHSQTQTKDYSNPHKQKLIADIANLQREYRDRSPSDTPSASSTESQKTISNPEWRSVNRQSDERDSKTQSQETVRSRRFIAQPSQPSTQLVGAAPENSAQYTDLMNASVGETVGPELPPLSVPDDYLPDTPTQFAGYIWPAKGVFTSGYGWRWGRMHKGIDIAAPIGTPIMAAAPGEVIFAGWNSGGFGNLVKIKHADGSITMYAHNSKILVRQGQTVEQGEQISEMGSTGFSTGPHLHFEIHPNGENAVNPIAYLPKERS
jgi:murein DD-endopeptidase MepM/ murein hydrolase activator NlpD